MRLKNFEITADGCSVDRAYEILMQIVHNGLKKFTTDGNKKISFYILFHSCALYPKVQLGFRKEFALCLKVV